jgi:hypothetical protein
LNRRAGCSIDIRRPQLGGQEMAARRTRTANSGSNRSSQPTFVAVPSISKMISSGGV